MDQSDDDRQFFLKRLLHLFRAETPEKDTKQEIYEILDEVEEKGFIDEDQGDMIHNIIVLKDTSVSEIMVPKVDMVALEQGASLNDLIALINEHSCSRVPIFEKHLDNIIGVIYAKDILKHLGQSDISLRQLMHAPYFVPESKKLTDLLNEFRQQRTKMAIIIDEFGNVDGMITIGDIIEEIVGEMHGEDEKHFEHDLVDNLDGSYTIDPKMPVDEFMEAFGIQMPEGDFDTIAGFITCQLERIPKSGETLQFEELLFRIAEADKRRISKLIVESKQVPTT